MKKQMMMMLIVVGMLLLIPQNCEASTTDFKILYFSWNRRSGYICVQGEVQNLGTKPMSVQLQVVFRDRNARVVMVDDFWLPGPFIDRNIKPKEKWAFDVIIGECILAKTLEMKIIGTFQK